MTINEEDFKNDPHAATYVHELELHREATGSLMDQLNSPENVGRLEVAQELGHPALTGIASRLEADPAIARVLATGASGYRFRQAVGVAVRLKMEQLGWSKTGRKGVVRGARYFTKAEHYTR